MALRTILLPLSCLNEGGEISSSGDYGMMRRVENVYCGEKIQLSIVEEESKLPSG